MTAKKGNGKKPAAAKKAPAKKPAAKKAPAKKATTAAKATAKEKVVKPPEFNEQAANEVNEPAHILEQAPDAFTDDVEYKKLMFSVGAQLKDAVQQIAFYSEQIFKVQNLQAGTVIQTIQGSVVDASLYQQLAQQNQELQTQITAIQQQYTNLQGHYTNLYNMYNQVTGAQPNVPR